MGKMCIRAGNALPLPACSTRGDGAGQGAHIPMGPWGTPGYNTGAEAQRGSIMICYSGAATGSRDIPKLGDCWHRVSGSGCKPQN